MQFPKRPSNALASQYEMLCGLSRNANNMGVICHARSLPTSWVPAAEKPEWAALANEFTAVLAQLRELNEVRKQLRAVQREIVEGEAPNARAAGLDAALCFEAYIEPAAAQEPVTTRWEQLMRDTLARWGAAKDAYLAKLNTARTAPTGQNIIDGRPLPVRWGYDDLDLPFRPAA